jgi:hypothetical protein
MEGLKKIMESNLNSPMRCEQPSSPATPLELDPIVVDIVSRIIMGTEPFVHDEFRGARIPAIDLIFASEWLLGRLKELDARRDLIPKGQHRRVIDFDRSAQKFRKTFLSLADRQGLILLPLKEDAVR